MLWGFVRFLHPRKQRSDIRCGTSKNNSFEDHVRIAQKQSFVTEFSSWWFQPIWKILVKIGSFPQGWKIKNIWVATSQFCVGFPTNNMENTFEPRRWTIQLDPSFIDPFCWEGQFIWLAVVIWDGWKIFKKSAAFFLPADFSRSKQNRNTTFYSTKTSQKEKQKFSLSKYQQYPTQMPLRHTHLEPNQHQ